MHKPTEPQTQPMPDQADALQLQREEALPATQNTRRLSLCALRKVVAWSPEPLPKPAVDDELTELPVVERAAETLRYSALRLEYAVSPSGALREWTKLVLRVAAAIAVPCVLLVPAVTYFLGGFAQWTTFLRAAAINLVVTVAALIAFVLLLTVLIGIIRSAVRSRQRDQTLRT